MKKIQQLWLVPLKDVQQSLESELLISYEKQSHK